MAFLLARMMAPGVLYFATQKGGHRQNLPRTYFTKRLLKLPATPNQKNFVGLGTYTNCKLFVLKVLLVMTLMTTLTSPSARSLSGSPLEAPHSLGMHVLITCQYCPQKSSFHSDPPNVGASHSDMQKQSGLLLLQKLCLSTMPESTKAPTTTSTSATGTKPVQMRMRLKTIEAVDRLCESAGIDNRTQAVSMAVHLVDWLISQQEKGGTLYIELPSGEKERIAVVGI